MTTKNFMNVVRFKLKSDCVDKYFEVIDKTNFEGMTQRYIAKTGDYDYCFVGIWKSADAIAAQRLALKLDFTSNDYLTREEDDTDNT